MASQEEFEIQAASPHWAIMPNWAAMAWAKRMAELSSLLGLGMIVAAESLANLSRHALKPRPDNDEAYRGWDLERAYIRQAPRQPIVAEVGRFFAGPAFWLGLAAGASAAAAVTLLARSQSR